MISGRDAVAKAGIVLAGGLAIGQMFSFVRNVAVARLIGPANFGVAATFLLLISMLDMLSDVNPDKLLIQAPDGNEPELQATGQLVHFVRGLINSAILAVFAFPVARIFHAPAASWAFLSLSLVPLIRAFAHLDPKRFQRSLQFMPDVYVELGGQIAALAVAVALAIWLKNYWAIAGSLIAQAATMVVISFVTAERSYRWSRHHDYLKRLMAFGWPLLINGALLFAIMQGDRLIVASTRSLTDLGIYSVAATLTMMPSIFIGRVNASIMLPAFSNVQDQPTRFIRRYEESTRSLSAIAACTFVIMALVGGHLVRILYGQQYIDAISLVPWMAAMYAVRIVRAAPSMAAMSKGDSRNCMFTNIFRITGVVGACAMAMIGANLITIIICGFIGEVIALLAAIILLKRKYQLPILPTINALHLPLVAACLAVGANWFGISWIGAIVLGAVIVCIISFPVLRTLILGVAAFRRPVSASNL